jgi:hypothetical protein
VGLCVVLLAGCGSSTKSSSSLSSSSGSGSSGSGSSGSGLGSGSGSGSGSSGGTAVSLSVLGSSGNLNGVACGKQEPFEHYSAPAQVRYAGTVSPVPAGRWKVKLKLKICRGGSFVEVGSQKIVGQASGRFDGAFPIAKAGSYSLRAKLEGSGGNPESPKVYLELQ